MADELLGVLGPSDFSAFQNSVVQNDPYGIMGRSLASWQPNTATWSPETTAATAFGKAFLAGMLGNYARQNAADQINSVAAVLPQLQKDPMNLAAPEGVDSDAFAALRGTAILKNYQNQILSGQANSKGVSELMQTVLARGVESGNISPAQALKAAQSGKYDDIMNTTAGPLDNPNSPAYKLDKDKKEASLKIDERITNARDYLKNSEEGRALSALKPAVSQIVSTLDRNDKASDVVVFTALGKALDPVGAISDQTVRTAEQAIPYLEKQFGSAQGFFTGQGTLTREGKLKILQVVADKANAYADSYGALVSNEKKRLQTLGADPAQLTHIDFNKFDTGKFITPEVPPGMKLQRNKVTGETRLVPQ